MKLCISIIEDALEKPVIFKNYSGTAPIFCLESWEFYCGQTTLRDDTLYIAYAEVLPQSLCKQNGGKILCVGMPFGIDATAPVHVLSIGGESNLQDIANKVNYIFNEYNKLENRLYEAVIKGRSIQYLVELMAPYFHQNELFVNDHDFRFIGRTNYFCRLCEVTGIKQHDPEILPQEVVTFFKNDIIFANVRNLKEPFVYEPSVFAIRCLCMNVFHGGEFSCRVVVSEDRNPYRDYDAGLLRFFSSFIQLVFDIPALHGNIFPTNHTVDMFATLLRGEYVEKFRLENSAIQNGLRLSGPFACAKIMLSERDYYNRTISYYCQQFNRDFKGTWSFEYDGAITCVINLEYYNASLERFASAHLATFRDGYFRVGYSDVFSDIMELKSRYIQASIALRTGLQALPSQWCYMFSDMVLHYVESKLVEELDGRFLCAPVVLTLQQYDVENQTSYLQTLRHYLDNQFNAVRTAKSLFIHRTTMEYRLHRIEELVGIDFKNPHQMLTLFLSLNFFVKD